MHSHKHHIDAVTAKIHANAAEHGIPSEGSEQMIHEGLTNVSKLFDLANARNEKDGDHQLQLHLLGIKSLCQHFKDLGGSSELMNRTISAVDYALKGTLPK